MLTPSYANPAGGESAAPLGRFEKIYPGRLLSPPVWLAALGLLLAGYAVFGKGFAYLGMPPLFVGEIVLAWGAAVLLLKSRWRGLLDSPVMWLMALYMMWCAFQTLPYISVYGFSAVRDAVLWGYCAFAVIVLSAFLSRPELLRAVIGRYAAYAPVFLLLSPVVWALARGYEASMPQWPWADVGILDQKTGDVLVHFSGLLAFWVAGFAGRVALWRVLCLAGSVGLLGMNSRGGLLAFLMVFGICMLHRPSDRTLWRIVSLGALFLAFLAVSDVAVVLPNKDRELSLEQITDNVSSIFVDSGNTDLEGKKEWRLQWWSDIVGYTVFGDYFWTGKGFGINLADDDGYQGTAWGGLLRSPHNGHLTVLARAGVPALVLWVLLHLAWLASLGHAYLTSRLKRQTHWSGLFLVLICYYVAISARGAFDVYLEGPMGGIWLWAVFGAGIAAVWIYYHAPEVLDPAAAAPSSVAESLRAASVETGR